MAVTDPPAATPPPANEVGYLLAFLYKIRFDPTTNAEFKTNWYGVMNAFGLTPEEQELVITLHPQNQLSDGEKASKWAQLVALLLPEFYEWTYDVPPSWW